jgi:ATP-dependent helicase/nuclease subunit B
MGNWIFPTTEALQTRVIAEADEKTLILTSGGRLARQMRHAFRMDRMHKGFSGWLPPRVMSLNAWLLETWRMAWPEETLASPIKILQLWNKSVNSFDLPEGLSADIQLFQILDETYRVRIRDKVPSPSNGYAGPIMAWRNKVFQDFEQSLSDQGTIHPSVLPLKVLDPKFLEPRIPWKKIFLIGFDFPAPIESDLLNGLIRRFGAIPCRTEPAQEPEVSALSLPNQEEEVVWLLEQVLSAAQYHPLHRIGLVVPNLSQYVPIITSAFRELLGPPIEEDVGNYNISLGQSLWDQPLTQAGLLPMRFFLEGESRTLLLSLLLSPYYRKWSANHDLLAQADVLWRKHSVDSGLRALYQCLVGQNFSGLCYIDTPEETLISLLQPLNRPRQGVVQWVESLSRCWGKLRFPAIHLPGEEGIYQHLLQILYQLGLELKTEILDGPGFFAWLKTLLSQTLVNEPGFEHSGIQVLGMIEARGLAFDHLFVAGLSQGSLPQPVRTFPFLNPEERRWVQGATIKSQFDFSRMAFNHLKTVSPRMALTRPEEEKGDPVPPSPFWPVQAEKGERNYWMFPGKVWSRAEWIKQTQQGIANYPLPHPPLDLPLTSVPARTDLDEIDPSSYSSRSESNDPHSLITTLSATAVETLLACPFKFFVERLMRISLLEEINIGISPLEKGDTLHKILALISDSLRTKSISLTDRQKAEKWIISCVQEVLKNKIQNPHWLVEKIRLIGEGEGLGGLLGLWMDMEKERWERGWRWEKTELPFYDLRLPTWSFSVQGRIDRIDYNDNLAEVCCWDYKTGVLPSSNDISKNFLAPQLPLYLLALKSLAILRPKSPEGFRAGHIGLKSEGELIMKEPWPETSAWEACLMDWENKIGQVGEKILQGDFPPDPRPVPRGKNQGACTYCLYKSLCSYWKKANSS